MNLLRIKMAPLEKIGMGVLIGGGAQIALHAAVNGGLPSKQGFDRTKAFALLFGESAIAVGSGAIFGMNVYLINRAIAIGLLGVDLALTPGASILPPSAPIPATQAVQPAAAPAPVRPPPPPKPTTTQKVMAYAAPLAPALTELLKIIPGLFGLASIEQPDEMVIHERQTIPTGRVTRSQDIQTKNVTVYDYNSRNATMIG
jgi:hypothetical protein